jgi:chorismate synthase
LSCWIGYIRRNNSKGFWDRRRPGQSRITTQRKEKDQVKILSGVFKGKTLGTPIALLIENEDAKSKDYSHIADLYRPSHADFTWESKFGLRDYRGGGRSSARETATRVAAGAVAKQLLGHFDIQILSYVSQIHSLSLENDKRNWTSKQVESNVVRCPDVDLAAKMEQLIVDIRKEGDSVGGVVTTTVQKCSPGMG